jgi:hypothetical protein
VIYGVRTRKTLSDSRVWYEANHKGGIALIAASLIALLLWAALWLLWDRNAAAFYGTAVLVAAMLVATALCLIQTRKL